MKKMNYKLFTLLVLMFCSINCFTQNIIRDIRVDFSEKSVNTSCVESLKEGDYYRLIIENINLNLFRVQINYSDTIYSKPLKTPSFAGFEFGAATEAISSLIDLEEGMKLADIQTFGFPEQELDTMTDSEKLKVRINQENKTLKAINEKMNNISRQIDELKLSVYLRKLNSLRFEGNNQPFDLDEAINQSIEIRQRLYLLKEKTNKTNNSFNEELERYDEDIRTEEAINKAISALKVAYDNLMVVLDLSIKEINAENIDTLLSQVVFLENNSSSTYSSLPIQFKGEQAKLGYKIIPRDEKYLLQTYSAEFLFPKRKSSYFSVGLSFYGSTLHDEVYSTIGAPNNDSTYVYKVVEEDYSRAEIGIVSLFRIGKKFKKCDFWGWHLNFGPGISISNNIKPRLLFGSGLSYGKRHNVAIDLGAITGYVDVLSESTNLGEQDSPKPDNITVSKLRFRGYISLGYYYAF